MSFWYTQNCAEVQHVTENKVGDTYELTVQCTGNLGDAQVNIYDYNQGGYIYSASKIDPGQHAITSIKIQKNSANQFVVSGLPYSINNKNYAIVLYCNKQLSEYRLGQ